MHVPPDGLLAAHSVAEAFLFVSLAYCPRCLRRPVRAAGELRRDPAQEDQWLLTIACPGCGENSDLHFSIHPPPTPSAAARINPAGEPSRLIDLAGWLALFRAILDGAGNQPDRGEARAMTLEAVQCLEEALRFLPPGEERPGPSAFFADASRQRFHDHPDQFCRSRLLALKDRLPTALPLNAPSSPAPKKKKWWRPWRA